MFGFEFVPHIQEYDILQLKKMYEGMHKNLDTQAQFVIIPHNPRTKTSVDSLLAAYILQQSMPYNLCVIPTLSGVAGLEEIKAQLLGIQYASFRAVALIGGESYNNRISAIDGVEIISLARDMLPHTIDIISGIGSLEHKTNQRRLEKKLRAGANHIITQPLFSVQAFKNNVHIFRQICDSLGIKAQIHIGVLGVLDSITAHNINLANLGFSVPKNYINRMGKENHSMRSYEVFKKLWKQMLEIAQQTNTPLYLCSAKPNDMRIYQGE